MKVVTIPEIIPEILEDSALATFCRTLCGHFEKITRIDGRHVRIPNGNVRSWISHIVDQYGRGIWLQESFERMTAWVSYDANGVNRISKVRKGEMGSAIP